MHAGTASAQQPAAAARQLAREILAGGRFHKASVPRPLHDVLREIGRLVQAPLSALEELVSKLGGHVSGGPAVVWAALALVVVLAGAALSTHGARRALRDPMPGETKRQGSLAPTAAELERQALAAEAHGRYGEAVRARFRAGLLRLAERDIVGDAAFALSADVLRALHSREFAQLARRFDQIAYGGSAAGAEDARSSRELWRRVLGEVTRR